MSADHHHSHGEGAGADAGCVDNTIKLSMEEIPLHQFYGLVVRRKVSKMPRAHSTPRRASQSFWTFNQSRPIKMICYSESFERDGDEAIL